MEGQNIWGLLYDFRKFAGLQVFFQALFSNDSLILIPEDASLNDKVESLIEYGCTCLSGTPSLFRLLLMSDRASKIPLRRVTLGGEIVDQKIIDVIKKVWPAVKVTHIYAATEFGVGFSVRDGKEGFPLEILNSNEEIYFSIGADGHLFFHNRLKNQSADTGDLVVLKNNRVFFNGRANGTISVGGRKVSPEEIEQVLLTHENVFACRVYSKKSSIIGDLVAADVVKSGLMDDRSLKTSLTVHCKNNLDAFKVPVFYNIVDSIDISSSGKLARL